MLLFGWLLISCLGILFRFAFTMRHQFRTANFLPLCYFIPKTSLSVSSLQLYKSYPIQGPGSFLSEEPLYCLYWILWINEPYFEVLPFYLKIYYNPCWVCNLQSSGASTLFPNIHYITACHHFCIIFYLFMICSKRDTAFPEKT